MKYLFLYLVCTSFIYWTSARGVNGGMSCAVCTVLMGVTIQVAEIHEENLANASKWLCQYLPSVARAPCMNVVEDIEPYFENISQKITPDLFCLAYGTCTVETDQELCHLFPLPYKKETVDNILREPKSLPKLDVCTLPFIEDICKILNNSFISLDAAEDYDKDGFSALTTARGSSWRGRDCADNDANQYPGRQPLGSDLNSDSNCNGIWGVQNTSSKSYEDVFCKKSESRGLIFIGDSIGAHFHMPEVWINPIKFEWPGLNATDVILNEIDWPQYGFATGFQNITPNVWIKGLTDSLYLRLRARNRCNHRDYQNLSQNGASSSEGVSHAKSISRNAKTDKPAIVFYAMQGNDVCNSFGDDTVDFMTSSKDFWSNVMKSLFILDEKLPYNSHVIFMGLVHAEFIYGAMANKLHPIGNLHQNVYYKDMYKWFNCMQIGPCSGWLNSNETLRNLTTEKSQKLTRILQHIVKNEKFEHFDLHFIENPINVIVAEERIDISLLLEPVDSLHPNQDAQPLMADVVWDAMLKLPPDVLGPINPHNEEIIKFFGDQGGH